VQREPENEVAGPEAGNSRTHEREGANAADKDRSQSRAADQRADAAAAFKLGGLLAQRGDLDAAVAAFCLADERGHSAGASNLGMLLEQQGDLEGAEAAYRRADVRGHAAGAYNLGVLLAERGDLAGAAVALRRAAADTDPEGARMARQALLSLGPSIESQVTEHAASHPTAPAETPPRVASHVRVAADSDSVSDTHAGRGHARTRAGMSTARTRASPLLRPRTLFGVGAVMIVLGIAGLAEGRTHVQTNAPSSRATSPSVSQHPGWTSHQSGIDPTRSQPGG
jgi:hypothetical protein